MNDFVTMWAKPATSRVLRTLAERSEPVSIRDLSRLAAVSVGTAHRVASELAARGVAEVRPERRRKLVRLRRPLPSRWLPPAFDAVRAVDVAELQKRRVPVRLVSGRDLTALGWPMRLREIALLPSSWARRVSLEQPTVIFRHERPLQWKRLRPEDVAVAMLDINPIAARALFERAKLDRRRLRKRIFEEDKVDRAAIVGLTERLGLPAPKHVERIPEQQIQRQLRQNPPRRVT